MKNKLFYNLAVYVFLIIVLKEIFTELVPRKIILYNAITLALTFFLTLIAIIYINKKEIKRMFTIYKKNWNVFLKKNLMTWLIGFILMMISNYIIIFLLNNNLSLNEQSVRDIYQNSFLAALFINVFLAPFLEEFVFRLGFNNIKNKYLYLFLSSFVFALFHAFESFYNLISLVYILPYFALGLTFGIVYYRSSNVFDSIVIHALHNAVILFLYFIL